MERFKKYIIAGISLLIGAFLPYLYSYADSYAKNAQLIVYIISIALFLTGLLVITLLQYHKRSHQVRYSVLVFVIDEKKKLLTVNNKHHNRLMIPCGIIPRQMTPNEAARRFLLQQAGLNDKDCINYVYRSKKSVDQKNLCPYDAQIEFVTKHEKRVKLHYAFIYFLKIKKGASPLSNAIFYNLKQLESMPDDRGLFSDILARYRNFLKETAKEDAAQ